MFKKSSSIYCVSDNQCITVIKNTDGFCYISPGIFTINNDLLLNWHLKTSNTQCLTFYFSDSLPNHIIVRNQSQSNINSMLEINNSSQSKVKFVEFDDKFESILYEENSIKFNDVKSNANYIDLVIEENYGIDKNGRKILGK